MIRARLRPVSLTLLSASLLMSLAQGGGPAIASTITVTKEADTNDGTCDGDCSLREAVIAANDADGPDVISLPAGTYSLTITGSGENNGETGDLDTRFEALTISGAGSATTIIETGAGGDRVLEVRNESTSVSGVTIRNGGGGPGFGGGNGGGVLVFDGSGLTLTGSVVTGNTAEGDGGGIYVDYGSSLTLSNTSVTDNAAAGGGGGIIVSPTASATVTGSTVNANTADSASGAVQNDGSLTIVDSTLAGNVSGGEGGAIRSNETLTITGSTISGNTAGSYAAILAYGTLTMTNSTISGNTASLETSGLQNGGTLTLTNVTMANNTSPAGGAFTNNTSGPLTTAHVRNVIIAGNSPADCAHFAPITSSTHSLDSDGTCGFAGPGDLPGADPQLGLLAANGGPTKTHALPPGSPAVDASDGAVCPAADQRGVSRPQGSGCDIGAYESEAEAGTSWGDADCDSDVDSVDSLKTLRHVAALSVAQTEPCPDIGTTVDIESASPHPWGDVDCDNDVDTVDALKLLRHVAALPVSQTEPCPDVGSDVEVSAP